ncbi:MAG: hypothetical protein CTY16_11115 [Methylobacter sp.]|nr:MAG: hypothetical protein CTY16_11115 [Methylobacter sp.]
MSGAAYMCKNRHGTYYARFIIPAQLREHFKNKREIRRSLQTDSRKLATKRARAFRVEFETITDKLMSELKKGVYSAFTARIEGVTVSTLHNGEKIPVTGKIERDLTEAEFEEHNHETNREDRKHLSQRLDEQAERLERKAREDALFHAQLAAITAQTASTPPPQATIPTSKKLSEYLDDYIAHKLKPGKKKNWSGGTARQLPNKLNVFRSLFGEKPAAALNRDDMEHYIKIAYAIPKNFGNPDHAKKFNGVTLDNILTNPPDLEVRLAGTVMGDLKVIMAFLNWVLEYKDLVALLPAKNAISNEISDIDYESKKRGFTPLELKTLFEEENGAPENYVKGFEKPINFWLPLIALYTGARLAEICQLLLSDIKPVKALSNDAEHWCFDINEDDDKKLKTKQSRRQIPVHKNLIDAGLLTYADDLRAKGETKLFPNAARTSDQFGSQSQWFGIYSSQAGITDKDTSFHSFRHNFCGYLAAHHIPEDLVIALTGHQFKSLAKSTYDRSGKRDVGKLAEVINSIDYGLRHPIYSNSDKVA